MAVPKVGIFWFISGKIFSDAIPWTEAPEYGGFYNGQNDHEKIWKQVQRTYPEARGQEYTDLPRGRVLYDKNHTTFYVYGSKELVRIQARKLMIAHEFSLPMAKTKFEADIHYEDMNSAIFTAMADEEFAK